MKRTLIIGGIGLLAFSGSVSLLNQRESSVVFNYNESNLEQNKIVLDQYTIVNNVEQENNNFNSNSTTSLFYVENDLISWNFSVYDQNNQIIEDVYLQTETISEQFSLNDSVSTSVPKHFYLNVESNVYDLGIIAPQSQIDQFINLVNEDALMEENSLIVFNTSEEGFYDYQITLNFDLQNIAAYIYLVQFSFYVIEDQEITLKSLNVSRNETNDLFINNENIEFLFYDDLNNDQNNNDKTIIKFNNIQEIENSYINLTFNNSETSDIGEVFTLPNLNETDGIQTVDYFYNESEEITYHYDKDTNKIIVEGIDYVWNENQLDENVLINISIKDSEGNKNISINLEYDQDQDIYYLDLNNYDQEYIDSISSGETIVKINDVIISATDPNDQERIINIINVDETFEFGKTKTNNFDYIAISILSLIILFLILLLIYLSLKDKNDKEVVEIDTLE